MHFATENSHQKHILKIAESYKKFRSKLKENDTNLLQFRTKISYHELYKAF